MKDTSKHLPVAEQIRKGLEEAIRHARGEITLKTTTVELPDEPPEIDAPTLVASRDQSRMSQAVFARLLNVSTKTVQSWSKAFAPPRTPPAGSSKSIVSTPRLSARASGFPRVNLQGVTIEKVAPGRRRIVIQGAPSNSEESRQVGQ